MRKRVRKEGVERERVGEVMAIKSSEKHLKSSFQKRHHKNKCPLIQYLQLFHTTYNNIFLTNTMEQNNCENKLGY